MDHIRIKGGRQLKGEIRISGSKNACAAADGRGAADRPAR